MRYFKSRLERETSLKIAFLILLIILSVIIVFKVSGLLGSMLVSIVAFYLLAPFVNRLERYNVPRVVSILFIYLIAGVVLYFVIEHFYVKFAEQFVSLQVELPNIVVRVLDKLKKTEILYAKSFPFIKDMGMVEFLQVKGTMITGKILANMPGFLSSMATFIILVPFFTFFLLLDSKKIKRFLLEITPNKYFETTLQLIYDINLQMGGFIQARLIEAAVVGGCVYAGLLAFNVNYAFFLSLFAAIMNLVPYVGPIIGAIPGLAVAYFYTDSLFVVGMVGIVYTVAQLIDTLLIIPLVFSKIINIHPMLVVILIITGSELMGILGMILIVPFFCIVKAICQAIYSRIVIAR